jgi:hypothetical protein
MHHVLRLALIATLAVVSPSCGDDPSPATAPITSEGAAPEPTPTISPDAVEVEIVNFCAWGIGFLAENDLYLLDGELAGIEHPGGAMWQRSDFPAEWDVTIWNESPVDGDDWMIRDAVAEPVDATSFDVRHFGTGDPIGVFVLDTTPIDERSLCG